MGVSVPSLHRESTDSLITCDEQELFFCKMIIRGDVTHDIQLFGVVTDE